MIKFDTQKILRPGTQIVDHQASTSANLKAAVENLDRLNIFSAKSRASLTKAITTDLFDIEATPSPLAFAIGYVAQPVLALKNLGEAAVHAVLAGAERRR